MGGGIAALFLRSARIPLKLVRLVILSGVAAGFGGVFGTPFAGAVFAAEISRMRSAWGSLLHFLVAALLADATCHAWGTTHTTYLIAPLFPAEQPGISELLAVATSVAAAGAVFGLGARLYVSLSKDCARALRALIPSPSLRASTGGCVVIALVWLAGTSDYLGLGVLPQTSESVTLPFFFQTVEVRPWSWCWKMLFTVVTLSSGFRGGEVTPLFFMGAALGNALSGILPAPSDLLAGLGLVALFGTAARTPIACWVMGLELFGIRQGPWLALACWVAFLVRGQETLYDPSPKQA
jgi:H+/Cl- antiporter ClcA